MRNVITISIILLSTGLCAQQVPQYSHYLFNQFQINPAVAGSKECMDMRFGYRTQWVGFDNAPRTAFASINGAIGNKRKSSSRNSTKHGVGISLESDTADPFGRTTVHAAYAYHFPVSREMTASIGLFAGFTQYRIDLSAVRGDPSVDDPVLSLGGIGTTSNLILPDVTPGFLLQNETFFIGLSVRHVTGPFIDDEVLDTNGQRIRVQRLARHFALSTGKAFPMTKTIKFIPSLLLKYVPAAPIALDVNAMVDFNQKLALGIGYRNNDAFVGLLKINFLDYFTLGYAYDYTTSPIKVASANSHEVTLGITACPASSGGGRRIPCAAYD